MSFVTLDFLFLGPAFFLYYYLLGYRQPVLTLTLFSLYFYSLWSIYYLPLLVFSALVDFVAARGIASSTSSKLRKFWLFFSISMNLGLLCFFKYWNFFSHSIEAATGVEIGVHDLLLPLGISFYTFQTLSYTFDVYRNKTKPEQSFLVYFLYVSFFPQLVAGPIERSGKLIPQLNSLKMPKVEDFYVGLVMVLWGVFLKICVANNFSPFVKSYFENANGGGFAWLIGYCAVFLIYCDFHSYSIIAKGLARGLGVHLSDNFKQPILASNLSAFWRSWHITLTKWIFDYVYLPLARRFPQEPHRSLIAIGALILVGFWHGASLNYLIFFLFIGVCLRLWRAVARWLAPFAPNNLTSKIFSYCSLTMILSLSGPMFVITDVNLLFQNLKNRFVFDSGVIEALGTGGKHQFMIGVALAMFVFFLDAWQKRRPDLFEATGKNMVVRAVFGATLVLCIITFGNFDSSEYIYFDF